MFEDVPGLELIELQPLLGSPATMALLVAGALRELAKSRLLRWLASPLLVLVNATGEAIDKRTPMSVREKLVGDFLAIGRKTPL